MTEPEPPPRPQVEEPESERDRWVVNLSILAILAILIGGGIWMANAMYEVRRIQDCAMQGRRNCAPIEAPPRILPQD
jgi:hypothetical protein